MPPINSEFKQAQLLYWCNLIVQRRTELHENVQEVQKAQHIERNCIKKIIHIEYSLEVLDWHSMLKKDK